jgi:3-hydroxymyristoyl/3-hydroxydecanoyl-(acyl carrier protein) dehydratase
MQAPEGLSPGPEVVQLFIPQRPPFLMLDRARALSLSEAPTLDGSRYLSANEPFFAGHFPGRPVLPGALILEGLAQTCAMLAALLHLGLDEERLWAELLNLERGYAGDAEHDPRRAERFRGALRPAGALGVAGATSLKFIRPVRPGCRLDYRVTLARQLEGAAHFRLLASVAGAPVTRGSLTASHLRG